MPLPYFSVWRLAEDLIIASLCPYLSLMELRARNDKTTKLTREAWLQRALEVLAREGQAKLRIEALTGSLGVTKGSFYWHFKNREDFVMALLEYWAREYTERVIEEMKQARGSARQRLLSLMETLHEQESARYDTAVRSWANQEPAVAAVVKRVDKARLRYVGSLFAELGFKGKELEMRTRTFVIYHSLKNGLFVRKSKKEERELVRLQHTWLTKR